MLRPKFVFGLAQSARGALGVGIQQGAWHGANFDVNFQLESLKLSKGEEVQTALPDDHNGQVSPAHFSGPPATNPEAFPSGEGEGQKGKPVSSSHTPGIIGHPLEPRKPADMAAGRAADVAVGRAVDVARMLSVPEQLFSQKGVLPFGMAPVVDSLRNSYPNGLVPWLPRNGYRPDQGPHLHALHSFSQQNHIAPASASGCTSGHEAVSVAKVVPSSILAKLPDRAGSLLAAKIPHIAKETGAGGQNETPSVSMLDTPARESSEGLRPAAVAALGFGGQASAPSPEKLLSTGSGLGPSSLSPRRGSSSLGATSAGASVQTRQHRDGSCAALRGSSAAPLLLPPAPALPTNPRQPEIDAWTALGDAPSPQEAAAVSTKEGDGQVRKRQQKEAAQGGKLKAADVQKKKRRWQGAGKQHKDGRMASVPRAAIPSPGVASQGAASGAGARSLTGRRQAGSPGGHQAAAGSTLLGSNSKEGAVGDVAKQFHAQAEGPDKSLFRKERTERYVSSLLLSLRKMHSQVLAQEGKLNAGHVEAALKWARSVDKYHASEVLKQESDPDVAMAFFDWAKRQPGFQVDCYHYTTLIGIAGKAKAGEMLQKVVGEMEASGMKKATVTYNRMIHAFGRLGMLEKALAIAEEMEVEGVPMDLHTFGALMDLHLKGGRMAECLQVFEKLKASSFTPQGIHVAIAMRALAAMGQAYLAVQLFEERRAQLSSPCLHTYNTVIDMLAKSGRFGQALEVFEQLRKSGAEIDIQTYTSAIDMCGKARRYAEAERIFNEMEAAGVEQDYVVWSSMVSMWGRAEQPKRAAFWFKRMLQSGMTPEVPCYNTLLWSFLRADMFDEAKLVLSSMISRGHKPTLMTYTMVLSECTLCQSEQGVVALMNLLDMMKHPGQELLHGLLQIAEQKESDQLLQEGPVRARIQAAWDQVDREDDEFLRAFADSVIEFLTKYEARRTAACFLDMVHKRGVFNRMFVPVGDDGVLTVDLHFMSIGTALVALSWTFRGIREGVFELSKPPTEMCIVTGAARRAKFRGVTKIKDVVVDCLHDAQSPFQMHPHNLGCLIASMESVERWLTTDACLEVFALIDKC